MTSRFEYALNPAQVEACERDGVVHLRKIIDKKWMGHGRNACTRNENDGGFPGHPITS